MGDGIGFNSGEFMLHGHAKNESSGNIAAVLAQKEPPGSLRKQIDELRVEAFDLAAIAAIDIFALRRRGRTGCEEGDGERDERAYASTTVRSSDR